jgi:hypothetical protein
MVSFVFSFEKIDRSEAADHFAIRMFLFPMVDGRRAPLGTYTGRSCTVVTRVPRSRSRREIWKVLSF